MIQFKTREGEGWTLVEFELSGPVSPDVLHGLTLPKVDFRKGVVLSGRGPVWLYACLVHHYHPAAWVATFDPRLGAVVVQSHKPGMQVGQVLSLDQEQGVPSAVRRRKPRFDSSPAR